MTGEACAKCGDPAGGWVGAEDAPDQHHDAKLRVWLCHRHLTPLWNAALRGDRLPLPGQERLFG